MTKFMKLPQLEEKRISKKTIFTHLIFGKQFIKVGGLLSPSDYDNILYLGHDEIYGDVFKAWDNNESCFNIYFGIKGDEFN